MARPAALGRGDAAAARRRLARARRVTARVHVRRAERRARREPSATADVEFRVWAPTAPSSWWRRRGDGDARARRRRAWTASSRRGSRAAPGDDYRFVLDGGRALARPVLALPARGRARPLARRRPGAFALDATRLAARRRSPTSCSTSCTSARSRADGHLRRGDPAPRASSRARRDGDRGDAGRDLPGRARLGLRRRLHLRAAPRPTAGPRASRGSSTPPTRAGLAVILDVVYNHVGPGRRGDRRLRPLLHRPLRDVLGRRDRLLAAPGVREWAIQNAELLGARLPRRRAAPRRHRTPSSTSRAPHVLAELAERVHALRPGALVIAEMETPATVRPIERVGPRRAVGGRAPPRAARPADRRAGGLLRELRRQVAELARELDAPPRTGARLVVCAQNHDQVGNRALGDRLPASALRLAAFCALLSPGTPLLFMGEEYGEPHPFQFFTDHVDPAIAEATREGRRREFARVRRLRRRGRARPAGPGDLPALEARPRRGDAGTARYYERPARLRRSSRTGRSTVEVDEDAAPAARAARRRGAAS